MISIERIRNNYEVLKSSLSLKGYNDDLNEIILKYPNIHFDFHDMSKV